MFRRIKTALVDSFVGAIAVGYLLAQALENIGYAFAAPFTRLMDEKALQLTSNSRAGHPSLSLAAGLPQLLSGCIYLFTAWVLLRWLYYNARKNQTPPQTPEPEQVA